MDVDEVVRKIQEVEIQGATNIARAGIELLRDLDRNGADADRIDAVAGRLRDARPTEPLLFNAIRIARETGDYGRVLDHIETAQDAITAAGRDLLSDGDVVYTHCHSSTVTSVLTATDADISVRVTETRPLYQGRITAQELAEAGIPVEFYVDSGARLALKDADHMFIGADAVTASGKVINKIGSELFAGAAEGYDVPVRVFTDSWKFDGRSRFGFEESHSVLGENGCSNNGPSDRCDLEERVASEVWPDAPDRVSVVNYAFERVAPGLITGIVSELGEHEPAAFMDAVAERYPEVVG